MSRTTLPALLLTSFLGFVSLARADGLRVGVYTLDEDQPVELAEALDAAAEHAVGRHPKLTLVRVGELAQPTSPTPETTAAIKSAEDEVAEADCHFTNGEMEDSKRLLEDALQAYQRLLPELVAAKGQAPLIDAWTKLARARYFAGDRAGAQAALAFVFALAPKTTFSRERFGAPLERTVIEAKLLADMLGAGQLAPESDPVGAEVLIDGNAVAGRTPLSGIECSPGPHYVTFRRRGYVTQTAIFAVQGSKEPQAAVRALERLPLLRPLYRARATLDSGHVDSAGEAAALGVDELVLLRAVPASAEAQLVLHAYRVTADGKVLHLVQTTPEASAPLDVEGLVDRVLSGEKPARVARAEGDSPWQRFRRWPGFWYVVGGVAAVVVVGTAVGAGVGASAHSSAGEQVLILGR